MKKLLPLIIVFFATTLFALQIKSPDFKNGEAIPAKFTCDGEDISPQLVISDIPKGTKSLVLIMDDPDAPMGTWVHWVVYNIPPQTRVLKRNFPKSETLKNGTIQGENSWGRIGYGGPCPPKGDKPHRYFFTLYAVDKKLNLPPGARKREILLAIKGHIIQKAQLMGKYRRK